MSPLARWRAVAVVALVGWAGTAIAWTMAADPAPGPRAHDTRAGRQPSAERSERRAQRTRRVLPTRRPETRPDAGTPDLSVLRDEVRNEVLDEIEQERAERRRQRSEHHLERLLDDVAQFTQEHDLDATTQAALQASAATMHDQLESLRAQRPPGPPGPGGPPPEVMESIETAFEQMQDEVADVLDDPDLVDAFADRMTPRPLRDRP